VAGAAVLERLTVSRQPVRWHVATVHAVRAESPSARTLVLDVPGWPSHRPGQHVDVRLTAEDGYQASRSYSIASAPEQIAPPAPDPLAPPASGPHAPPAPVIELTVERFEDGEVSPYLVDVVEPGDELEVRGPIGGPFTWTVRDGGPLFLIGGGSGMVPLMAMLRHRAAHPAEGAAIATHVLVSNRSEAAGFYTRELETLEPRSGLRVDWTYTREPPSGWTGWARRIDGDLLDAAGPPPAQRPAAHVFVCGPTPFVEAVTELLVAQRYDPRRIRAERFGPTG
jgi:ferredoxin-NADP reductase